MHKKKILLSTILTILFTAVVIGTLFLNNPRHSLAARQTSIAPSMQSSQSTQLASGIVSGNIYYGSNGSSVYALDATSGTLIWKYHLKGYATAWLLGIQNGIVYVSLSKGPQGLVYTLIAALQATNGSLFWLSSQAIDAPLGYVGSFQIVNENIYISANDGGNDLYTFKASNGSLLWSFPLSLGYVWTIVISQDSVYTYSSYTQGPPFPKTCALNANDGSVRWCYQNASIVAYLKGIVYANFTDPNTTASDAIALNANNGSLLWSVSGMQVARVVQNIVYATNQNGTSALNASNGALLMTYQNASFLFSHLGVVYGVDSSYGLEAFKQSDGNLLWQYNFWGVGLMACLPPKNGVLYCLSHDYLTEFALNATNGTLLWQFNLGSKGTDYFSPCSYPFNNVLYCTGNGNQTLFALKAYNVTLLWKHVFIGSSGLQTVLNGIAYVLTWTETNGNPVAHLHALNASNGTLLWSYQ